MVSTKVSALSAQQSYMHLNPVIEKLSQGKHVFGVSTSDFSLQNARSLARDPDIDFVYLDMEHGAMRFDQLEIFLSGMTDKAGILERDNAQAHPAVFARFAPYASEEAQWVVKHALDLGLMGILINNVETPQQAENIVRTMRYMPARDSNDSYPAGSPRHCRRRAVVLGHLWSRVQGAGRPLAAQSRRAISCSGR